MIIYKHEESGEAAGFRYQRDRIPVPEGWLSIPGDRIPGDISVYHEQLYIDAQALKNQETELLNLIKENEYHLISRRFADDVEAWEAKLDEWAAQLVTVQGGTLVEIAEKPVF